MQRTSKAIIISVISLLFIGTAYIALLSLNKPTTPVTASQTVVSTVQPPTVTELLKLVNEERNKAGVAPLILDERLNKSAQQKADDMVTNDYYSHVDKNGRHGYDIAHELAPDICQQPSENLNMSTTEITSKGVVDSWVSSVSHYKAMVDPRYEYTGFGLNGNKVVQHFC